MAEIKQIWCDKSVWCDEDKMFYPEIKEENGRLYKLDKETFVYLEQLELGLTAEEQELMSEPIGRWGAEWQKFMTENHPEVIPSLKGRLKWELIPRQIDKEAWEYRTLLKKQYAEKNPRPKTFVEIRKWENTLGMILDRAVIEDIVHQYRE